MHPLLLLLLSLSPLPTYSFPLCASSVDEIRSIDLSRRNAYIMATKREPEHTNYAKVHLLINLIQKPLNIQKHPLIEFRLQTCLLAGVSLEIQVFTTPVCRFFLCSFGFLSSSSLCIIRIYVTCLYHTVNQVQLQVIRFINPQSLAPVAPFI